MSYNGGTYDGEHGMAGIFKELTMYNLPITAAEYDPLIDTTAAACGISCDICEGGDQCFNALNDPEVVEYRFDGLATYPVPSQIDPFSGAGPSFNEQFYNDYYFVDDQGVRTGKTAGYFPTSDPTLALGTNSFTMEFTAKYSGPAGDAVTLETAGGAAAVAVSWVSATELSVTVGGSTVNFPFATSA